MIQRKNSKLREEEVKNLLREVYFRAYDATPILGNIDFAVRRNTNPLWGGDTPVAEQQNDKQHDGDKSVAAPCNHFSEEAKQVMDAGRELWRYYHAQPNANPDASFYDIRLHFQGTKTTASGKVQMNPARPDAHYTQLITTLRHRLKVLAKKIEPKVYEYGFLKK